MKRLVTGFALILGLLLYGCSGDKAYNELLQKFIPKEEDGRAREFIELVHANDLDKAAGMLRPEWKLEEVKKGLKEIQQVFDHGKIIKLETIGAHIDSMNNSGVKTKTTTLEYQLQFSDAWVTGTVVFFEKDNASFITSARFRPISDSLDVLTAFTFSHKLPLHYIIFSLCVAFPVLSIYALIACIRTKMRRKWLWVLFIIFGFGQLHLNWYNGQWDFQPLSILLFSSSAMRASPYAPWVLGVALPVGAVIFLLRRRKLAIVESPMQN